MGKGTSGAASPEDALYRKLFVLIPVVTFLVYVRVLGQPYLNFDDDWYIYNNPYVAGLTWERLVELFARPHHGQYSPLAQLYLAGLFKMGGGQPYVMNVFAVLLHITNSLLVFLLIRRLIGEYRGAFVVAALFALAPMQVESVAWLTAIFKISACLSLVAMLLYVRFLDTRKAVYYGAVVLLFILSMATKEQAVLLPASLLLIDYVRGRRLRSRQVIVEKLPLFAMSLGYGILTLGIAATGQDVAAQAVPLAHKAYLVCLALASYVQKLLVPVGLSFLYSYPILQEGLGPAQFAIIVVVPAGIVGSLIAARRERSAMFGILFFLVNISLSLLFVLLTLRDSYMADRYVYLASLGVFLVLYVVIAKLVAARPGGKRIAQVAVLTYIVVLTVASYKRTVVFSSPEPLWTDTIKKNPDNFYAYYNRAFFYRSNGDYQSAIRDYERAIEANPLFHLGYYQLGRIYFQAGDMDKALLYTTGAIETYAQTRREAAGAPHYLDAYNNRAAMYASSGRFEEALADLNFVLANDRSRTDALSNRSSVLYDLGRYQDCLRDLQRLLGENPNDARSLNLAGLCYSSVGDAANAIRFFDRAIAVNPRQGAFWLNRSQAHVQTQNRDKALSDALQAQRLGASVDPDYLNGLRN